jgi:hypothetical protein
MLLACDQPDAPLNFVAEVALANQLEVQPLLTAIWAYALHLSPESLPAKELCKFVTQLQGRNFVEKAQLMSELPEWVIQEAGVAKTQALDRKFKRVYTKINYEQSKHSLLREGNEGYSKLLLLLAGIKDSHEAAAIWKKIL